MVGHGWPKAPISTRPIFGSEAPSRPICRFVLDASMQCRDFLQTASRYESREKCRDTSMHRRRIRIDTDFHRKNTDSSQEIVACLVSLRPGRQGL